MEVGKGEEMRRGKVEKVRENEESGSRKVRGNKGRRSRENYERGSR